MIHCRYLTAFDQPRDQLEASLYALMGDLDAVYENSTATVEFKKAADILTGLWEKVRERPNEFLDRRTIEHEGLDAAARDLYGFDLILLRPDMHVAWRGNRAPPDPASLAARVTGQLE